jgi:hypothetical protein
MSIFNRRDVLRLAGAGVGVVFVSRLARAAGGDDGEFFVQLSDTHWGYRGAANPDADVTLARAVAAVNALDKRPAFAVFTGDLTHDTDDAKLRLDRMKSFRDVVGKLDVKDVHFLPGEHDAAKDRGDAYRQVFGEPRWSFDRAGVHFVALDNASSPDGSLGEAQITALAADLTRVKTPVVVFAHRPLFELYNEWDWFTADGARALDVLDKHGPATVFYGHIHQEHHFVTGSVRHHAAKSLMFPLPLAGSQPKRAPLPWDPGSPDHGLGFRTVRTPALTVAERALTTAPTTAPTTSTDHGW